MTTRRRQRGTNAEMDLNKRSNHGKNKFQEKVSIKSYMLNERFAPDTLPFF